MFHYEAGIYEFPTPPNWIEFIVWSCVIGAGPAMILSPFLLVPALGLLALFRSVVAKRLRRMDGLMPFLAAQWSFALECF